MYGGLRASLPQLDGAVRSPGLSQNVSIERDALGTPTVTAANRIDLAYGTGFVHGQDRYFQMDLARRLAAGELTSLVGEAARAQDAKAHVFGFRAVARRALAQATTGQRAILAAYTRGVNAGLGSLRSRPWEYWVLRSRPVGWKEEDTYLVVYSMWWDLQYGGFARERLRQQLKARLGADSCALYPARSPWDAPNESDAVSTPAAPAASGATRDVLASAGALPGLEVETPADAGSNNWAVAGWRTARGGALVASDMHLTLRVPTTWYRARLRTGALDLNGLTLPGAPVLVAGSNGRIAWGFTNSYGNWLDLADGVPHWLATVPEATNLNLMNFETVDSVEEAMTLAAQIGIPQQNMVVGDRAGHIAWTIAGRIPRETGIGRNTGATWLDDAAQPRIVDPPAGLVWSANGLATDDPRQVQAIGGERAACGADYDLGARARQIREDLMALQHPATPADMLAIQLDDRALFLAGWHELALTVLDAAALRERSQRVAFKALIAGWDGRADVDSVGYRLVHDFRAHTESAVWQGFLDAQGIATDEGPPPRFEVALWRHVATQPRLLLAQIDATIADDRAACGTLPRCTWGRRHPVQIRHPLSAALPFLAWVLDMPILALPGDHNLPRVQDGNFGASERFAVTPGRESEGYLHIAGGQSGHPLSPYYRAGFTEWAQGRPLPFLPGKSEHRLILQPR